MDRRRALVAIAVLFCGGADHRVSAQSAKVYRIGVLEITSATSNRTNLDALLRGLREAGYVEGRNLIIDYRSADGHPERFPELATDLVRAKPDINLTRGTLATQAAKKTTAIPIVMTAAADPVRAGLVANLARPGGNITGFSTIITELHGKRLEMLTALVPAAKRVAYLASAANPNTSPSWKEVERAARSLGLEARLFDARDADTVNRALESAMAQGVDALLTTVETVMLANRAVIVDFANSHKLPGMYSAREFVEVGGLISYGVHYPDLYHRAASYVDKILKGAKPGDLPIEQPTKLELIINLKTARALGLNIPRELLLRADEVIE
ncbi:MAG: ABC transporter substrate-binding protein [Betaproteobacteria bacterium]|nr:MAG: ABC transporter substrate-binding protein [Betaproteobacteria bacterium]